MDPATTAFYQRYAQDLVARNEAAESAMSRYFHRAFTPGGRVLDVGAGSGRDLAVLQREGYEAYGVEPNAAMRAAAVLAHPALAQRLLEAGLPDLGKPFGGDFDGVLCSAVLMHVPEADLAEAALALRALLKPQGRLLISLPLMRCDLVDGGRDQAGRLFRNHSPEAMRLLLECLGFVQLERWETEDSGANTLWSTLLFKLCADPSQAGHESV
jgi:SAM-dependent methyltransferase